MFRLYYSDRTSDDLENLDRNDTQSRYHSLRLQLRPTIKHYRPMHDRVAPFVFYQVLRRTFPVFGIAKKKAVQG